MEIREVNRYSSAVKSQIDNFLALLTSNEVSFTEATLKEIISSEGSHLFLAFDDYEDPTKKFMAEESLESEILPRSTDIIMMLENANNYLKAQKSETDAGLMDNFQQLIYATSVLGVVLLIIGIVLAALISGAITKPINYLRIVIDRLGKGDLVKIEKSKVSNDEIGDMATSLSSMAEGFGEIAVFAKDIGDGKYDSEFTPLSESDMLGNALLEMRTNLRTVAEEDKKRNWSTSGLAKFGDILRSYNDNFEKLADEIISNLVKYIEANQGALFIIENNDAASEEEYMELAACYAWDKKKFLDKKIYRGEGLSGQACKWSCCEQVLRYRWHLPF